MERLQGRAWPDHLINDEQWAIYHRVITRARERHVPFAVGGGFAVATHTGQWRNTKDLDLYILPRDRDAMVQIVTEAGLADYYERKPYDRRWIYRANVDDTIVDVIWAMANLRVEVDEGWLRDVCRARVRGLELPVVPLEEMVWDKLYVLQRDRCDWPDVLNMLYASGETLDWNYLLDRVADDMPLLSAAVSLYRWLCPGRSRKLPPWIWERLDLPAPVGPPAPECEPYRADLLDTRPWFAEAEPQC
jgi:hypothetical protein